MKYIITHLVFTFVFLLLNFNCSAQTPYGYVLTNEVNENGGVVQLDIYAGISYPDGSNETLEGAFVDYEVYSGSAIAGVDFIASSGELIYQDGVSTISVEILDNNFVNGGRYFNVDIVVDGAVFASGVSEVQIIDDDAPKTIIVDSVADTVSPIVEGEPITLRSALASADSGDLILFHASLDAAVIKLENGALSIGGAKSIDASTLSNGITIDGDSMSRVLICEQGSVVSIRNVRITGGKAEDGLNDFGGGMLQVEDKLGGCGGGVLNRGDLSLFDCDIYENSAGRGGLDYDDPNFGGGVGGNGGSGGAICNYGTLTVDRCHIRNNNAGEGGEGVIVGGMGGDGGGIFSVGGDLTINTTIIQENYAGNGGGGVGPFFVESGKGGDGGGVYCEGATVEKSVFVDNWAGSGGSFLNEFGQDFTNGGDGGSGGGIIATRDLLVSCVNCVFTANHRGFGGTGGMSNGSDGVGGGVSVDAAVARLSSCTVVGNWGAVGGGIAARGSGGSLRIENTIVALNLGGGSEPDVSPSTFGLSLTLTGVNFIGNPSGTGLSSGPNMITGDPELAPLGYFGGFTPCMPPLPRSPVIDVSSDISSESLDQRGLPRVFGGHLDLGAVEYQGNSDAELIWMDDSDADGIPFGLELAVGSDSGVADRDNAFLPKLSESGFGIDFGVSPTAMKRTVWIVEESSDLVGFSEIFRLDGPYDRISTAIGVSFDRGVNGISVFRDSMEVSPRFYYRLRVEPALGFDQSCRLAPDVDEVIVNFNLGASNPAPPYSTITFSARLDISDPMIDGEEMYVSIYGDSDGQDLLQVRNETVIWFTEGGTKYGELTTANAIFDPMLDGVFSIGFRMKSGSARLVSAAVIGNKANGVSTFVQTVFACATEN